MFSRFNPWTRARNAEARLARMSESYRELNSNYSNLFNVAWDRRRALNEIVQSVDGINTPNGTLRKVRRIAAKATEEHVTA